MEHLDEQEHIRLKALLQRTGEFIAYFELAETKMMAWRHDIASQATRYQQQLQQLHKEQEQLKNMLTDTGIRQCQTLMEQALQQINTHLEAIKDMSHHIQKQILIFDENTTSLLDGVLAKITHHTTQSLEHIDKQLSQFDATLFPQIAHESCEQIEKTANNAVIKSQKLLQFFHWRTAVLAFATSLITAFTIGLYMSNEFPWETHQTVMNERNAGKMLIAAWPKLSYQEKIKILGEQGVQKG